MTRRNRMVVLVTNAEGSPDLCATFVEAPICNATKASTMTWRSPAPKMKATAHP